VSKNDALVALNSASLSWQGCMQMRQSSRNCCLPKAPRSLSYLLILNKLLHTETPDIINKSLHPLL
jgi:hypothetical protein